MCRPDPQLGSLRDGQLQGWRFKAASRRQTLPGRRRGSSLTRIFTLLPPTSDPSPRSCHAAQSKIGRRKNNEGDIMRLLQIVLQRPSQRSGGGKMGGAERSEFWPTGLDGSRSEFRTSVVTHRPTQMSHCWENSRLLESQYF